MNWEFLPELQLFLLAQKIETESDYCNFGLVCKRWRDFWPELRRPILLGQTGSQGEFTFNGLSSQLPLRLDTQLFFNMESYLHLCCGASFTWIIIRDPVTRVISACNPFKVRQSIILGCLFSPPDFGPNFVVNKVIFSHPPSQANCTAVAICCQWTRVAVWTKGSSWVWCPNLINGWFADLTFWHGNLYLVDTERNIYQCHYTRPTNPSITVIPNQDRGEQVSLVQYDHFYLIGSIPDVLLLLSVCTTGDVDFELYRVDISSTVFLCPQDTMPDFGVFLGKNRDFAIPSRFLPGGLGTVFLVDYLNENSSKIFSLRLPYHTSRLTCPDTPMEWKARLWLLPCLNFADVRVLTESRGIPDSTNDEDYEDKECRKKKRKIEKEVAAESAGQDGAPHEVLTSKSLTATVQNFCGEFHLEAEKASQNHEGTLSRDEDQYVWKSFADGSVTVARDMSGEQLCKGENISPYLKEYQLDFLEERRLKDLVKQQSMFIRHPIYLWTEKSFEKEIIDDEYEGDLEEIDEESKSKKKVKEVSPELELINKQKLIWLRKPEEITREEYASYKSPTNDWEDHLTVKHFSVEGQLQFKAILFVPKRAPFDLFDIRKNSNNIKLYVRMDLIMDNCEDLIPEYLSFVMGIVDLDDLPLNISRETLQQSKIPKMIRKNPVKRCLEMFSEIAENKEEYTKFYESSSKNLKLGIHEDSQNKAKLADLLRYHSTKSGEELTSLKDYVSRMKEGQKEIFYITGLSKKAVENSPFLERLKRKGYEVLFTVDVIDEFAVEQLMQYYSKKLVSVTKKAAFESLCMTIMEIIGDHVEKVVASERNVDSPCVLMTDGECGWTANMERILKAVALSGQMAMYNGTSSHILVQIALYGSMSSDMLSKKRTMDINPENGIMEELRKMAEANENNKSVRNLVMVLHETGLLASRFSLDEPSTFTRR